MEHGCFARCHYADRRFHYHTPQLPPNHFAFLGHSLMWSRHFPKVLGNITRQPCTIPHLQTDDIVESAVKRSSVRSLFSVSTANFDRLLNT